MSLNFRDCHAKIRQVDSQATVGNAVVVQVNISKTQQHQHDDFLTQKNRREHVCGPYSPCIFLFFNNAFNEMNGCHLIGYWRTLQ